MKRVYDALRHRLAAAQNWPGCSHIGRQTAYERRNVKEFARREAHNAVCAGFSHGYHARFHHGEMPELQQRLQMGAKHGQNAGDPWGKYDLYRHVEGAKMAG